MPIIKYTFSYIDKLLNKRIEFEFDCFERAMQKAKQVYQDNIAANDTMYILKNLYADEENAKKHLTLQSYMQWSYAFSGVNYE